ncbi:MAG: TolC family protein [Polyangiaceae bacterium]|jgi:cobalt-zinc-cadmium efflux system outer membrane protein
MTLPRAARPAIALAFLVTLLFPGRADADGVVPQAVEIPQQLTLDQSIQILRTRSLDVLIAEAAVRSAEGDETAASAVPNLALSLGYGRVLPPYSVSGCSGCSANQYTIGLADQAAIEDSLSGKRDLRIKVAHAALQAAKLSRNDALRNIQFQVKSAYAAVAQAQRGLAFAKENQATNVKTLQLFQIRLKSGAINEGDLARVETQKLEADQAVEQAMVTVRQARVALAFLLGVRGPTPEFTVDDKVLDFAVPPSLATAQLDGLLRSAFEHRPDLQAQGYQRSSAEAAIALAKRQVFPDITVSAQYTQTGEGNAAIQPPTLSFGLSAPIPIFYQQQGEIRKAEAAYDTQSLQQAKTTAQVVNDVSTAMAGYESTRALVERMEKLLKPSAERAFSITRLQYDKGAATLMDFLDAQRTYIATNVEYLQDLANYWTAVFQVEQAVGTELH